MYRESQKRRKRKKRKISSSKSRRSKSSNEKYGSSRRVQCTITLEAVNED